MVPPPPQSPTTPAAPAQSTPSQQPTAQTPAARPATPAQAPTPPQQPAPTPAATPQQPSQPQLHRVTDPASGRDLGFELYDKDGIVVGYCDKLSDVTIKLPDGSSAQRDVIEVRPLGHVYGYSVTTFSYTPHKDASDLKWHAFKRNVDPSKSGKDWAIPSFWSASNERKLTALYMLAARQLGTLNSPEAIELEKIAAAGKFGKKGKQAKTVGTAAGMIAAVTVVGNEYIHHSIYNLLNDHFGHTNTTTINKPGETVYVDNHFATLLKDVKEKAKDVWTSAQIDHNWGHNTSANITALENILAKDGIADAIWSTPAYQAAAKAAGITNKSVLYDKTFSELAKLSDVINLQDGIKYVHTQALKDAKEVTKDIANLTNNYTGASLKNITALDELIAKDGIIEKIMALDSKQPKEQLYTKSFGDLAQIAYTIGGDASQQAMISAHLAVMAKAKEAVGDVFSDKDLSDNYAGVTIANITALENLISIDPQIDSTFADHYIADYFGHTGLAKKAAYTDSNLQAKVQAGVEYKFFAKQYDTNLTADKLLNVSGSVRTDALSSLQYIAGQYNWLGGFYSKNITEDLTDKIATNATYLNSTWGQAILDLSNFGADKVEVYKTGDGKTLIQGYQNGNLIAKAGKEGAYADNGAAYNTIKDL